MYLHHSSHIGNSLCLIVVLCACIYHALYTPASVFRAQAAALVRDCGSRFNAMLPQTWQSAAKLPPVVQTPPPALAAELYTRGNAAQAEGNLDAAVDLFKQAIQLSPTFGAAHSNLGNVFLQQNRLREALATHLDALKHRPGESRPLFNVGVCHQMLGQHQQAVEFYKKALTMQPDYINAQYNLALAYQDSNDLAQAAKHYQALLALQPSHADGRLNLCNVRLAQGGNAVDGEAEQCYKSASALHPGHSRTLVNLAALYHSRADAGGVAGGDAGSSARSADAAVLPVGPEHRAWACRR